MFKMTLTKILAIILSITVLGIIIGLIFFGFNSVSVWLQSMAVDLILAIIMAAIAGLIIDVLYRKYSPQSKILKTTVTHTPNNNLSYAKLILPNNNNIVVDGAEKIIGREDFVGVISTDKLLFIGKDHFKITKDNDSFFIQDLNTKNGTEVNGEKLIQNEMKLLSSGDDIMVGKTLSMRYREKNS
jgi:hypothetical protein